MPTMKMVPAIQIQQKLRAGIWGGEKMGKSHLMLSMAIQLHEPGDDPLTTIGVISTEHGWTSMLARKFPHQAIKLAKDDGDNDVENPFSIERHTQALNMFLRAGYKIICLDSATHVWAGPGGTLEMVD